MRSNSQEDKITKFADADYFFFLEHKWKGTRLFDTEKELEEKTYFVWKLSQ